MRSGLSSTTAAESAWAAGLAPAIGISMTWVASSPAPVHDGKAVPLARWQRHAQVLHVGSFYDLNVLVLHVADIGGPDVAVDHEHDQVSQVSTHLDALDQPV